MLIKQILKEYEDLESEKQNIIKTISGLSAQDEQQAALLDRIYKLLNSESITGKINSAFASPMADEYMSDKAKESHRIEITKIIAGLDSDYGAMNKFLDRLESGGVINIEQLAKPINSFNAVFGGDPVAISAFNQLKTYGVGQNQKGPGEFALAMLSDKIRLAQGEGNITRENGSCRSGESGCG